MAVVGHEGQVRPLGKSTAYDDDVHDDDDHHHYENDEDDALKYVEGMNERKGGAGI